MAKIDCDFSKKLTLREIQGVMLDLLKEIHTFCEQHGIRYSMAYGSLIGVVRHKGFIPWDDDIDIVMPRPDYERFIREFHSDRARLAIPGQDSYMAIARVCDTRDTVAFTKYPFLRRGDRCGVWIDVYAMDNVSDDPAEFDRHAEECRRRYSEMIKFRKSLVTLADLRHIPGHHHLLRRWIRALVKRLKYAGKNYMAKNREHLQLMQKYPWGSTKHISKLGIRRWVYHDHLPADLLDHNVLMPFEDMQVRAVKDYDTFLTPCYADYMTIPPVEKREQHTVCDTVFYRRRK